MWIAAIPHLLTYILFLNHLAPFAIAAALSPASLDPDCWKDRDGAPTITFKECLDIVGDKVIWGRDVDLPLKFSRDPNHGPDIKLPASWFSDAGNCMVGLDLAPGETGADRASPLDLVRATKKIGVDCIIKPPHRGGTMRIGWGDKMYLVIMGPEKSGKYTFLGVGGNQTVENGTRANE